MTLTAVVDFTDHSVLFREIHALVAGDLYNPLVLDFSRLPKATVDAIKTSNLTLVLKRSQTGATVASVPQFSLVPNHWALRSASLALTTRAVKDWFTELSKQTGDVTVDTNGWLEVTDGTTTFVACPVPVVLRDITVRGDVSGYYTAAQVDALLAGKQDGLTFDNSPSLGSTNPVTSNGIMVALNNKADAAATAAAIALKASSSDVTAALAGKVGPAELAAALASYATAVDMNAALALKADAEDVDAALATKIGQTELASALSSYATTASVDTAVSGKADSSDVTAALALKADTSALELKADAATTYTKNEVDALISGGGGSSGGQPDVRFLDPEGTALMSGTTELGRIRAVSRTGNAVSKIVVTGTAATYAGTHVLTPDSSWSSTSAGGGVVAYVPAASKFVFSYDGTDTEVQVTLPSSLGAPLSQVADVTPTDGNDDRAVSSGGTYDFVTSQVATRVSTTLHNDDLVATRLITAQNATSAAAAARGTANNLNLLLAFESGIYTKEQVDLLLAGKAPAFTVTAPLQYSNGILSISTSGLQTEILVGGQPVSTTVDTAVTQGSQNLVTSGAVHTAIETGVADWDMYECLDGKLHLNSINFIDMSKAFPRDLVVPCHPYKSGIKSRMFAICLKGEPPGQDPFSSITDEYTGNGAILISNGSLWSEAEPLQSRIHASLVPGHDYAVIARFYEVIPGYFFTFDI